MAELISLQAADRNMLPPEALTRLAQLENKVLFGTDEVRRTYRGKIEAIGIMTQSAEMLSFNAKLEKYLSESTLSADSKKDIEQLNTIAKKES